jgi:hypothetical protein
MSSVCHALLTIRNLTRTQFGFQMFNYERDYGQKNGEMHTQPNVEDPPVIPRINSELFCERKALGIRHRSAAFCHHRRDFGLANCRSGRRDQRISPNYGDLKNFEKHGRKVVCKVQAIPKGRFVRRSHARR